jgi:hypothetical protein
LSITISLFGFAMAAFGIYALLSSLAMQSIPLALFSTLPIIVGTIPIINTYSLLKSYDEKSLRDFILVLSLVSFIAASELTAIHTSLSYAYASLASLAFFFLAKRFVLPALTEDTVAMHRSDQAPPPGPGVWRQKETD